MNNTDLDNKIFELKNDIIRDVQEIIKIKSVEEKNNLEFPFGKGIHDCLLHCLKLNWRNYLYRGRNIR